MSKDQPPLSLRAARGWWLPLMIVLCLAASRVAEAADKTLRCGNRLVGLGEAPFEVIAKCGEPDWIESWEEAPNSLIFHHYDYKHERYRLPKLIKGPLFKERWTYNFGSNRLLRTLLFLNGRLIRIETGHRGRP